MGDLAVTLSIINISMFILGMIGCLNTMRYVEHSHKAPYLKAAIVIFLMFTFIMSLWFVVAQGKWLLNDHNSVVGDTAAMLWLVYDYAKAVHTLAAIAMVYIYLCWVGKSELLHETHRLRRRRTDD